VRLICQKNGLVGWFHHPWKDRAFPIICCTETPVDIATHITHQQRTSGRYYIYHKHREREREREREISEKLYCKQKWRS
jgi:hypothetical protein